MDKNGQLIAFMTKQSVEKPSKQKVDNVYHLPVKNTSKIISLN